MFRCSRYRRRFTRVFHSLRDTPPTVCCVDVLELYFLWLAGCCLVLKHDSCGFCRVFFFFCRSCCWSKVCMEGKATCEKLYCCGFCSEQGGRMAQFLRVAAASTIPHGSARRWGALVNSSARDFFFLLCEGRQSSA